MTTIHKNTFYTQSLITNIICFIIYFIIICYPGININENSNFNQNIFDHDKTTLNYGDNILSSPHDIEYNNTIFDNTINYLTSIHKCYDIKNIMVFYPKYWDIHYFTEIYPQSQIIINYVKPFPNAKLYEIDCFNYNSDFCDPFKYLSKIDIQAVKINHYCKMDNKLDFNLTKYFKYSIINISVTLFEY